MKKAFLLLCLLLASCFAKRSGKDVKNESSNKSPASALSSAPVPKIPSQLAREKDVKDHQILRLSRYLEQADAVHREAWWVVSAERKQQGKSLFGKAARALQYELGMKLGNKSLFHCDHYSLRRDLPSPTGLPQSGEIFEKCGGAAPLIADYRLPDARSAEMNFYPQHLEEVMGLATSILNRKVHCRFTGTEDGKLESLDCQNLAQDRSATQSIQFSTYSYRLSAKNTLTLKGQVFENLSPMRKIEAEVPLEGKIKVVETQVEAPEGYAKPTPKPRTPPPPKDADQDRKHIAPLGNGESVRALPPAEGGVPVDPDMLRYQQSEVPPAGEGPATGLPDPAESGVNPQDGMVDDQGMPAPVNGPSGPEGSPNQNPLPEPELIPPAPLPSAR